MLNCTLSKILMIALILANSVNGFELWATRWHDKFIKNLKKYVREEAPHTLEQKKLIYYF